MITLTKAYSVEEIGKIYKDAGKKNIRQILSNSVDWISDIDKFSWIKDVCMGVDRLYRMKYLKNCLFYIKHSWIGIYQVP